MIDGFRLGFHEEALELLVELESALLALDERPDDAELVGRAFRALHTIKGSGAMFGFDEIAAFVHNLEAVFDQLRKGDLVANSELINLTLEAGDQIKKMLNADGTPQAIVVGAGCARILSELRRVTGFSGTLTPAVGPANHEGERCEAPPSGPREHWRICFRPGPDVLLNGTNPILLLRELQELGDLRLTIDVGAIPPLSDLQPENCYVAWDLTLTTSASKEAIRDVFIFVEDDCELKIERVSPGSPQGGDQPLGAVAVGGQIPPEGKQVSAGVTADRSQSVTSSIRVSAEKLDQLVNLVGELVTVQARLSEFAARRDDPDIVAISEEVDRLTSELRENSMSIRMLPLRNTFERFRRLVHDLSLELDKEVELAIEGADTELDKTVIDQLNDPLVHLIRNALDHGIETGEERQASGKRPTATIRLSAMHSGAQVLIRVSDDGRGLDAQAVRARAIEQGLIDGSTQLSESELFSLILSPGFSTARKLTDISGRGVGMDVVRRNVEALRGSIEMSSRPGLGLTVTLRLPLTLAIIDGLLVRVGSAYFILPLANSLECVELSEADIQNAHGNHLANVRGETVPYIRLREYFEMECAPAENGQYVPEQIMVVETDDGQFGLVVDEVLGNHQTVIKNLGRLYRDLPMVSGATILGNGTVALILDLHRLVQNAVQMTLQNKRAGGRKPRRSAWDGRSPRPSQLAKQPVHD